AKLADFNVSYGSKLEGSTPAAYFGGSLAYMSPEQLEACHPEYDRLPEDLDGRSDLYSLAVVLWELLTGERPFHDEGVEADWSTTLGTLLKVRSRAPLQPESETHDDQSAALFALLSRCLQRDPANRVATAGELARE